MGAFYGSVPIRGVDRDSVRAAVEALAEKQGGRFLLGPELNGWVGVYPNMHGQDVTIAGRLAKSLGGHLFALVVHEDDVFVYDYYRDGRLVDQYNSRPDYFEAVSARQKAKYRGHPERFAELASDQTRFEALRILRVYDWTEVTQAERDTPRPLVAVDLHPYLEETPEGTVQQQSYVYDVAHDPDCDRLVFGGLDGRLRYLDLASGLSGVLLDPPGRPPILALCLSRDRTALAVVVDPDMSSRSRRKRGPIAQFWNYPALCERAIRMTAEH